MGSFLETSCCSSVSVMFLVKESGEYKPVIVKFENVLFGSNV